MSHPIRSMTGFGETERDVEAGRLRVEIRTVNHRNLNVHLRTPSGFDRHHRGMERVLKEHFARGNVHVSVLLDRASDGRGRDGLVIDVERARTYVSALQGLQEELDLGGTVDIGVLPWFRDLFRESEGESAVPDVPEDALMDAVAAAAGAVARMREEEGTRLAEDLHGRLAAMDGLVEEVAERAPQRLVAERDRLREAIAELLGDGFSVDEERIAREIAHLAERWDIHEEVVRFRSHLQMFREALERGDEGGVGKRLGFIAQELLREANTMGSKANDAEIARAVVQIKEEIERLREQLENVE